MDAQYEYIECGFTQFWEYCDILTEKIDFKEGDAIAVLKASRDGGVYLGCILEHLLGIEVYELNYKVTETEDGILVELVGPFPPGLTGRRVYFFTEMVNSGRIAGPAVIDLQKRKNEVTMIAIYYRIGSDIPEGIKFIHLIKVDCPVRFSHWE